MVSGKGNLHEMLFPLCPLNIFPLSTVAFASQRGGTGLRRPICGLEAYLKINIFPFSPKSSSAPSPLHAGATDLWLTETTDTESTDTGGGCTLASIIN